MTAYRQGRSVHVVDLPDKCPDGTPNQINRLTVEVRYAAEEEEGPRYARGIALDNIVLPRIVAGLTDRPKVLVLSLRSVVFCLHAQGLTRGTTSVIVRHMLDTEERQQQPAHGYDQATGEMFARLVRDELPAALDAVYGAS